MIHTTTLTVTGMNCGACVRHVTRALEGLTGVVHVDVDLDRALAVVANLSEQADAAALVAAIRDAGYQARVEDSVADDASTPTTRSTGCGCGCVGMAS